MSETKHTPGPWRATKVGGTVLDLSNRVVAHISSECDNPAQRLANARLIAAAPDLLAALTEFVEQAESYCNSTGHKEDGSAMYGACDAICAAIPAGRAAIAKAKGGVQ